MTHALQAIIEHYFPLDIVKTEPVPFGLTNTTCFVTVNDQKYVARHYDLYTKTPESLHLEMDVTSFLLRSNLSFNIPSFLPTQNGHLYVTLSDGSLGALVTFLQGTAPPIQTPDDAYLFGRVVGEVSARLSEYERPKNIKYDGIPFTNLYQLHPLATEEITASFWKKPPFPVTDEQKHYYNEALISVETNRKALLSLPLQLVHHDLLVFNLLSVDRCITGVLDFDFLAVDISFLEFVISLNHVLQMSGGSLEMSAAFIEGYASFRTLSSEELSQLRTLTRLYHIAVLHIYIGQNRAGKDISTAFAYIANQLIERDNWLERNEGHLRGLLAPYT
ncbi:phosphotransferase [Paenibacillus sp. FSL H8-0537]|uniref:phosphotransferase enzyme family protein n=1 Tax=Paenibacillus sp. FSL H8-0537 TaxID=2921399 RepID=UPI0031010EC7